MINMALISIAVSWGFGRHLASLDPTRSIQALKYDYIQQPFHVMSSCFGRISFALFLVEIVQKFVMRRRFLYALMVSQFAVNGTTAIIIMVQCRPIQALWNHRVDGDCLNPRVQEYYSFFQGCKYCHSSRMCFFTDLTSCQRNHGFHAGRLPGHVYMAAQCETAEENWLDDGDVSRYLVSLCSSFLLQMISKAHKLQFYGRYDYQSSANKIFGVKIRLHVWVS